MTESAIKIDGRWQELLSRLEESPWRQLVYVIGGNDTGKTTFCRFLAEGLSKKHPTAYINCDPGQSVVGPPATIGISLCRAGLTGRTALRFIGSTSPFRHMLPLLTGSARLRDKAVELGVRKIIVDSSGFVYGPAGMAFQFEMIDLLRPDIVVGIAGKKEERHSLDRLVRNFKKGHSLYIRFPVHRAVVKRSPEERRVYREEKFSEYFRGARLRSFSFRGLGLHGRIPEENEGETPRGRLAALTDGKHFVLTLGILDDIDLHRRVVRLYAFPFKRSSLATLHFGSLRIDLSGRHTLL